MKVAFDGLCPASLPGPDKEAPSTSIHQLPDQLITRTGWKEKDLVDYGNTSNLKLSGEIDYRITEKLEAIASINYNESGGDMRLNIVAEDFEAVEKIRAGINAVGLEAVMESSSAQADGVRGQGQRHLCT